jgi:hypothetical protein
MGVNKEIAGSQAVPGLAVTISWLDLDDEASVTAFKNHVVNWAGRGEQV